MTARLSRLKKELEMLATDPGPGISAWPADESNMMHLQAQIQGPQDSPYQEGLFSLTIDVPDRYPMEPPSVRFVTPIYHPNIDNDGRICLDTLKMPPHGSWSPSVNINTLLLTIRVLMSSPNADDGLVPDITEEYKRDVALWRRKALEHTRLNAIPKNVTISPAKPQASVRSTQTGVVDRIVDESVDKEGDKQSENSDSSSDDDDDDSDDDDSSEDGSENLTSEGKRIPEDNLSGELQWKFARRDS